MGEPIYVIEIGSGENSVFYNGTHHANEWITSTLLLTFLENYAAAYAFSGTIFGQQADSLFQLSTLHIAPMVNPDGAALVTGYLTYGEYYDRASAISRNYPQISFPDGWKANIDGMILICNILQGGVPHRRSSSRRVMFPRLRAIM